MAGAPGVENWRPVVGYESNYEVSDLGRVRNRHGRVLRPTPDKDGYPRLSLSAEGQAKNFHVHTLVLEAFVGLRPEGMEACHNNATRSDNKATNLRWDTQLHNIKDRDARGATYRGTRHHFSKLDPDDVRKIRKLLTMKFSQRKIATLFSVKQKTIYNIANHRTWKAVV